MNLAAVLECVFSRVKSTGDADRVTVLVPTVYSRGFEYVSITTTL